MSFVLSSGIRDSNSRPSAWEADALPTELIPRLVSDPHRIQTCNLLIRSQMLYSVELGDLFPLFVGLSLLARELALLDPGLLTREIAQVEYPGSANLTDLVQLDVLDER